MKRRRTMPDNVLIPLPGFQLPNDFPWRVGLVAMVDEQLRRLRATGHFVPPRFFGYYFQANVPIGIGGSWTVSLARTNPAILIPGMLNKLTHGQYSITSRGRGKSPEYLLVHDRRGGACWLWSFDDGLRFVESVEPVFGWDDAHTPKVFGP